MLKSLLIVVIVYGLAVLLKLQTILWLMNIIAPALVIGFALIFQPEIRKLFIRIGQNGWFAFGTRSKHTYVDAVLIAYNDPQFLEGRQPQNKQFFKIADIGAGTGRYSVALAKEGFDVTAVELVKHNLEILESKHERVKCWPGNALDLGFLPDEIFDTTILFGPLYHLHKEEEKLTALKEARRITKKGGIIFAAYLV